MKKLVRNLFAVIAATALVGSLASCADSDAEDPFATTSTNANSAGGNGGAGNGGGDNGNQGAQGAGQAKYTNNEITFPVTEASTNAEKTVLLVKYDRTAAGKAELIKVTNAGLKVWKNGKHIKTIDTIEFALDDYGASFSGATGQISDENDMKEYKVKLSIGDTVAKGDIIKVKLDEKAFIEAIGKDAANVNPESVVVALVDIDPSVNYYKELCENSDLYKPFLTKKEENTQQGGGGTGGQQQPTDGTGTGGQQPSGNGGNGGAATVVKTLNLTVNHYENADHGIQYTEDMSAIPVDAKNGDVWTLKIAGTADAEFRGDMQFVNANWAGITGESISKTFTTTAFSYEIDFTFSADCSDGKFMLGNAGLTPAVAKTLKLTEYSFTKKSSGSPSQNSGNEGNNGQAASTRSISGSKTDITVATASGTTPNVRVSFQYNRAQGESAITITNAVIKIYKNGEVIKELNKIDNFELNLWYTGDGSFSGATSGPLQNEDAKQYRALIALDGVSVVANDTISVEIASGTVNGAHTASLANDGLMSSLLDGDNSLCNWGAVGVVSADTQS